MENQECLYYQNVEINILDADTRELIQYDFAIMPYPVSGSPFVNGISGLYWIVRGGHDTITLPIREHKTFVSFYIEGKCQESPSFQALGYEPNFVAVDNDNGSLYPLIGRENSQMEKELNMIILPRVINLYLRKKDSPNT